jgi:hypothetical protein
MPTRETETVGVGPAAKQVAEHASSLARLELELAALELKKKVAAFVFALWFAFATIAAGLATAMDTWLALLITTGILVVLAAGLGFVAAGLIRKGSPPVPEQAIEEARKTTEALKSNGTS